MRPLRNAWLAAALLLGQTAIASADETGSMSVTVQVTSTCKLGTASLDFGAYAVGQRTELRGQGIITYEGCSGLDTTVALDGGRSGNTKARTLVGAGGEKLVYQLFKNSTRSQVWGTDTDALVPRLTASGAGIIPVFGSIAGGQQVAAGRYTDSVVITLSF